MEKSNALIRLLELPLLYRTWQAPFAEKKLRPFFRRPETKSVHRVLDVGCGPGTNAAHFQHLDYTGLDLNPRYIAYASTHYRGTFVVADATRFEAQGEPFDVILLNSLLHHIDDDGVRHLLRQLTLLMTGQSRLHVFDLVLPAERSIARLLARLDRGEHPRPLETWRSIFREFFEEEHFEPYPLSAFGVTLWQMVYFVGRKKTLG